MSSTKKDSGVSADRIYRFGAYCLVPRQRVLLLENEPVPIGSRAFAILVALVERAGSIVSAPELIRIAWPGVVVDEANLRVQIGSLRKLLGGGTSKRRTIDTVPLQGYCFVMPVEQVSARSSEPPVEATHEHNLPAELTTTVGRQETVGLLSEAVSSRRLITITGPGGIGKTTVALAVARRCLSQFLDGARFVDFSPISDPQLVTTVVASKLGIGALSEDPMAGLLAHLTGKQLLLVLDTCEHVVETIAVLTETLLAHLPEIRILTTSREALRAAGEWVHRLQPLPVPPEAASQRAAEIMTYPSVDLFVQRVAANLDQFELRDADAPFVSTICRQLDGIPLAIEFAAAHVEEIGLREVAARLNDRFSILSRGRRTALARHQTLAATLEWSYDLLPERERTVLRHLSVFRGAFTGDAVRAVATYDLEKQQASVALSNLHLKSLVTVNIGAEVVLYRLLDTTRLFAAQKQEPTGERESAQRRHAHYVLGALQAAEREWETQEAAAWTARYGYLIEDARGALEWAFSPAGDRELGVLLTAAASPLWFALSLLEEYRRHIERSLAAVEAGVSAAAPAVIRLWDSLGHAVWHTRGNMPAMATAFGRAWDIADQENRLDDKLRALWGRLVFANTNGEYADSLATLERFAALAATVDSPKVQVTYQRMAALGLHYAGHQARAREHAEYVLNHPSSRAGRARQSGLQFDQRITARSMLARILWIQGYADLARSNAHEGLELSRSTGHALSECFVLANAIIPIAFWSGELATAASMTGLLLVRSREHGFEIWNAFGRSYDAVLQRRKDPTVEVPRHSTVGAHLSEMLATFDESLVDEELLDRGARGTAGWATPELLRIGANRAFANGKSNAGAEAALLQAVELARRQGALAWELRATSNLADLLQRESRQPEAHRLLNSVVARFSEGFSTADLTSAAAKLVRLGH